MEIAIIAAVAVLGYLLIRATSPSTTATGAPSPSLLSGSSSLPLIGGALTGAEAFLSSLSGPTSQASINQSLAQAPVITSKNTGSQVYGPVAPVSVSAPDFSNAGFGTSTPPSLSFLSGPTNPATGLGVDTVNANLLAPVPTAMAFPSNSGATNSAFSASLGTGLNLTDATVDPLATLTPSSIDNTDYSIF